MNYPSESNKEALNHLLEGKAFDHLTQEQQAAIKAEISETEYRQLRKMAVDAHSVLSIEDKLTPREDIRMYVRERMLNQPAKVARKKIFSSAIIQIVAAIALLVIGIQLTSRTSKGLIPGTQHESLFIDSTSTDSAMQHKSGPNEDSVLSLGERIETDALREESIEATVLREESIETAVLRKKRVETPALREEGIKTPTLGEVRTKAFYLSLQSSLLS